MELTSLCLVVLPFLSNNFREHTLLQETLNLLLLLKVSLILPLLLHFLFLLLNLQSLSH
ncbi:hypothetical protein ACMBCN_02375 [Candidatus Liberibacter asiaticus]|nr:hypothetical protein [Candidatus Liberibacter asiaticus]